MQVGDIEILPIVDGVFRVAPTEAYAQALAGDTPTKGGRDDDWAPHRAFISADGTLEMALGGFLTRIGDRTVLIDAGLGARPVGGMSGGQLLANLAAAGVSPEEVTDVVFTHLHFDHVGWATTSGSVVFPNATYRCQTHDWEHFVTADPAGGAARKLGPIEDRLVTWDGDGAILPGLDAMVAPGHTPGSTIVVISDGPARALLLGDVVHCPVELVDDEWAGMGDVDPALARRTRVALARELEGQDVPVVAAHFPGMEFGRLISAEGRRRWVV